MDGTLGCGGAEGVNFFFKHGHVEYQIDDDDEQNRMLVKLASYVQTSDIGARSNNIKFRLHCRILRFLYQTLCAYLQIKD